MVADSGWRVGHVIVWEKQVASQVVTACILARIRCVNLVEEL
jgi:hypothetical protein